MEAARRGEGLRAFLKALNEEGKQWLHKQNQRRHPKQFLSRSKTSSAPRPICTSGRKRRRVRKMRTSGNEKLKIHTTPSWRCRDAFYCCNTHLRPGIAKNPADERRIGKKQQTIHRTRVQGASWGRTDGSHPHR